MSHVPLEHAQFSALGPEYEESAQGLFRAHLEIPSMLAAIGEVRRCAVLDAGCGTGVYARLAARLGAGPVVGVDASEGMLEVARGLEKAEPLGIDYRAGDIGEAQGLAVDLVLAVYLLPYARSRLDLEAMCRGLARALGPGGRLVTAVLNPDFCDEPDWYRAYGFSLSTPGRRDEGDQVVLSVDQGAMVFEVTAHYWSGEAMEAALGLAGFTEISWSRPRVSRTGLDRYGAGFWDNYLTRPHALIVRARLAGEPT
ncbi:class I SAM-dependent methyltransferase [Streptomyces sp. NPDC098789]|uniref:class I SAM-dependent methyltransferase n=1 Tax=Streptomyces sp. NPDC098789 TaxID=3366098 RepID=UPI0038283B89